MSDRAVGFAPCFEGSLCVLDGEVDIFWGSRGYYCELFTSGGIQGFKGVVSFGGDELVVDEESGGDFVL